MICPECDKEMLVIEMNDVETDWCPGCGGIWLDEGELELIAGDGAAGGPIAAALNTSGTRLGGRNCPRCGKEMVLAQALTEPPVELDVCRSGHGAWFDKGELEKVLSSIRGEPVAEALSGLFGGKR